MKAQDLINEFIKLKQAKEYALEEITLQDSISLEENEFIVIERHFKKTGVTTNLIYYSNDLDYNFNNKPHLCTVNYGHITFIEGANDYILRGYKVTITEYLKEFEIAFLADEKGIVKDVKVKV